MLLAVMFFCLVIRLSDGVIYHLDDADYEKMPPLFGIDSNYDSCLKKPDGVYCLAKFDLDGDPRNELLNMIREYSQDEIKHYNHSYIERAICVSQSCKKFISNTRLDKTADLHNTLGSCVNYTMWREHGLEAKLSLIYYCDRNGEDVHIDVWDWIFAALLTLLLAMNLIGSAYDIINGKNHGGRNESAGNPYLLSFSIFKNWKQLTTINADPRYDRLRGLHGLKSIGTFFVAIAHIMWLVGCGFTDNPRDFELAHHRFHYQVIFSGMVIVQIFFVISGCLLSYHLQVLSEKQPLLWSNIPKILFLRWMRLTPGNAITVLFTATWLRHLGSGPLWNKYIKTTVTSCRNHWWQHLLYFNNYVKEDKFCAIQTWHVSAELQLFTVGLLAYAVVASHRRYVALTILGLLGMIGPALHVWLQDLDALVLHKPEFYRSFDNDTFWSMHIRGHNNLSSHAVGMAIGIVSYHCIKNKLEYPNSKLLKYLTWCMPLGVIGLFYSGILFYLDAQRPHVVLRMAYAAVQRPALGIMVALIVLDLVLKFENVYRKALEWRGWVVTSRLSYTVYLLHVNIIMILMGARTQLTHVSFFYVCNNPENGHHILAECVKNRDERDALMKSMDTNMLDIINHFGVVSLTLFVSIPFYLLLEAPVRSIAKTYVEELSKEKVKTM